MKLSYMQLALSMCLVGINISVGKAIVQSVPVFLFSEIRFMIAVPVLAAIIFIRQEIKISLKPKEWLFLFLQSLFGVFLFSIFMLYGVRYTSSISAGIITSTTPAFIALIAFFFLREKMKLKNGLSVLFAVLGIAAISYHGGSSAHNGMLGNLLILCAVISEALFTIFAKPLSSKIKPFQMAAMVNLFGLVLFLPFSVHQVMTVPLEIAPRIWLLIVYYSLTASVLSFILWYRGIAKVPANMAGLFTVFMPISSALVGFLFLNEAFSTRHVIGLSFALMAIVIGIWSPQRKEKNVPDL